MGFKSSTSNVSGLRGDTVLGSGGSGLGLGRRLGIRMGNGIAGRIGRYGLAGI